MPQDPLVLVQSATAIILRKRGFGAAFTLLAVSVIANHVWRILAPSLSQNPWRHPIETLKFARRSPSYFLEDSLESPWGWWLPRCALVAVCGMGVCAATSRRLLRCLVSFPDLAQTGDKVSKVQGTSTLRARSMAAADREIQPYLVVMAMVLIADLERAFMTACWVFAHVYAYTWICFSGSSAERQFVAKALTEHWYAAAFQACWAAFWLQRCAFPHSIAAIRQAAQGDVFAAMALAVCLCVTGHLVRYSNKYYVLLEMGDMLVTFGWLILAGGLLLVQRWKHMPTAN